MSRHEALPEDVRSLDGIIAALYETISFAPGGQPDWERLRSLFAEGGVLAPAPEAPGHPIEVLDLEAFIAGTAGQLEAGAGATGFHEREVGRRCESFGAVTHVMSAYRARRRPDDAESFASGVNSIQVARHSGRYWVVSILWDHAGADLPLPKY